jgi:hypothetical protein
MEKPSIKVVCDNLDELLDNPSQFVWEKDALTLASVSLGRGDFNPTYILMGYDEDDYYFVVENDEMSEDVYLEEGENFRSKFEELIQKEYNKLYLGRNHELIDEMQEYLLKESQMANMDLVFVNHESGEETRVTDPKVLEVMNSILEQAYLPFITKKLINRLDELGMLDK